MVRGFGVRATILAAALALTGPLFAQNGDASGDLALALERSEAARGRLDLPGALAILTAAIETQPQDDAPLVARAAIHRSMGRLSLALADLDTVLDRAPDDAAALAMRAETWRRAGAFDKAAADFTRAQRLRPEDAALAAGAAQALAEAGRKPEALEAYAHAVALAPDDAALRGARDALLDDLANAARPAFVYEPEALMAAQFTVDEGADTAPNRLIVVRDGAKLATEGAVRPDRLAQAVAVGAVRITHVFTYSGNNSTIWANLALICAGPALGATEAALISTQGRDALAAIDRNGDTAPLGALIAGAYLIGGQKLAEVEGCALDRGLALGYLANWTTAQERIGWRGDTYLDHAPAYVLNDGPVTVAWLDAWLAAQVAASGGESVAAKEEAVPEAIDDTPEPAAGEDGTGAVADPDTGPVVVADEVAPTADPALAPTSDDAAPALPDPVLPPVTVAEAALSRITLPPPHELAPMGEAAQDATDTPVLSTPDVAPEAGEAPDLSDADAPDPAISPEDGTDAPDIDAPHAAPEAGEAPILPAPDVPDSAISPEAGVETDLVVPAPPLADEADTTPMTDLAASEPEPDAAPEPAIPEGEAQPATEPGNADGSTDAGAEDIRLATILKGIWAPSLTQCLAYLDAIKTPETLDQAMPDPKADPPLGAMLLTSRRAQPFDGSGLVCLAESFATSGDESDAVLSCSEAGEVAGDMRLHAYPSGGPTPWLDVTHGTQATVAMRQCVTLGQLGLRFADLWRIDKTACTASAPLAGMMLEFRPEDGALWLTLRPTGDGAELPDPGALVAAVDDVALAPGTGALAAGSYSAPLGTFDEVAHHLSFGMFLFLSAPEDTGFPALRLPLLGSGKAMTALAECAAE